MAPQYELKHPRPASAERFILDLRGLGIPDVPLVGRYDYRSVHPGLPTHSHAGLVEICYLARGKQTYRAGGREYHLAGGDVFVTAPGEPHDTAGQPEDRGILYWIHLLMPRRGGSLLMLPARDSGVLIRQLLHLEHRHFPGSPELKAALDAVFALHSRPDAPLQRAAMVNQLVRFVLEVLECAQGRSRMRLSPAVQGVVRTIEAEPQENYALEALARLAGLSLSRFKVRFKTEVGIAPREFVLREKVQAARRMLAGDRSVTDVAMQLGFSSSQYFSTVFRRFTQQTPREFRKSGPSVPLCRIGG